ncbi:MAG: glycosyltransferase, partial [Paracoccus hibiscisoli]|uniref:glycosyltransferase n=1 Tax=Paracoccus hibiscisoli TaxID=2023261 RepID=UPI00391D5553
MTAGDTQAARAGTGARDVWAIIPAYNEATAIADVIEGLRDKGLAIVVVDDGSTDDTARAAASAGAAVVVHPINLGQGAALQTGIEYALARGAQFLVTFDAD